MFSGNDCSAMIQRPGICVYLFAYKLRLGGRYTLQNQWLGTNRIIRPDRGITAAAVSSRTDFIAGFSQCCGRLITRRRRKHNASISLSPQRFFCFGICVADY